jgi:2-C-methyl-D-erythritol 2,4-cyclodiphosphate synthase
MSAARVRIGEGIDRHCLQTGLPLVLGGVTIPFALGLAGHSDGDALTHALCNALLGALALGDLGEHFPDTDPTWKGAPSSTFLREVRSMVARQGWRIGNVDATIMAEHPRLAPYVPAMRSALAGLLELPQDAVSIKATRGEGVGPEGEGRSILVRAVALLVRD